MCIKLKIFLNCNRYSSGVRQILKFNFCIIRFDLNNNFSIYLDNLKNIPENIKTAISKCNIFIEQFNFNI